MLSEAEPVELPVSEGAPPAATDEDAATAEDAATGAEPIVHWLVYLEYQTPSSHADDDLLAVGAAKPEVELAAAKLDPTLELGAAVGAALSPTVT